MRSRAYNKKFSLYETTTVSDNYGGNNITTSLLSNSWAKIETFNIGSRDSNSTDFGLLDVNNALKITTRKRNDITYNSETQFIVYRGEKYIINTAPINVNFEDNIIQFIVVKASKEIFDYQQLQASLIASDYVLRVENDEGTVDNYDYLVEQLKLML